jgi:ATP-dependent RNA helicase RhlE
LKTEVVFGGVGIRPQKEALRRGVDILIATPGRLLDHLRQKHLNFRSLEVLVLDEADRMLDMGFLPDIRTILGQLPKERQTLFFSATLPTEVKKLAGEILTNPIRIEVTPQGTPAEGVRQVVYPVDSARKRELLVHLMDQEKMSQVLVFTRTKHRANDLAAHLVKKGKKVAALHGDKTQGARTQALEQFRRGAIQVLVATNLAARGLDVKGITHVVNFEMPEAPEDYVHRIGRTARAKGTGDAISLMAPTERGSLREIEQLIGARIPQVLVAGFEGKEPVQSNRPKSRPSFQPARKKENSWRTTDFKKPTKRW